MFLLKKIGWLLLECLLFGVIFIACIALFFFIFKFSGLNINFWNVDALTEASNPYILILSFLPVFISFSAAAIFTYSIIMKHPFGDLGLLGKESFLLFTKGFLLSIALIVPGFLILWFTGQIKILPITFNLTYIVGFLIFFFVQSTAEEIFTRTFLVPVVELRLGTVIAIVISASLFAVMHIGNDNFTWVGFFNILLGGFIMAYLFVHFRNIWICAGFHTGWNFIQASFFDFNVSGVDVYSFIQFQDAGYSRITGGSFGYEGSLLAILFQLIAFYLIYNKYKINIKPLIIKEPILQSESISTLPLEEKANNSSLD